MLYLIVPILIFYFFAKSYAKKNHAVYSNALIRSIGWSCLFCWTSISGGDIAIWGHNPSPLFSLPYWIAYYFVGYKPSDSGAAFFYTEPSLWVTPLVPIAWYMLVFYLYKENKAEIFSEIKQSIKPVSIFLIVYLIFMSVILVFSKPSSYLYPLSGSVAVFFAASVANRFSKFYVAQAFISVFASTIFIPYMVIFSSAPSVWAVINDVLIPMGIESLLMAIPIFSGVVAFYTVKYIEKRSNPGI
jgi:hypothetical protein